MNPAAWQSRVGAETFRGYGASRDRGGKQVPGTTTHVL